MGPLLRLQWCTQVFGRLPSGMAIVSFLTWGRAPLRKIAYTVLVAPIADPGRMKVLGRVPVVMAKSFPQ